MHSHAKRRHFRFSDKKFRLYKGKGMPTLYLPVLNPLCALTVNIRVVPGICQKLIDSRIFRVRATILPFNALVC